MMLIFETKTKKSKMYHVTPLFQIVSVKSSNEGKHLYLYIRVLNIAHLNIIYFLHIIKFLNTIEL